MKVLIIDDVADLLIAGLQEIGYSVTYLPNINRAEIIALIAPFEVLALASVGSTQGKEFTPVS